MTKFESDVTWSEKAPAGLTVKLRDSSFVVAKFSSLMF